MTRTANLRAPTVTPNSPVIAAIGSFDALTYRGLIAILGEDRRIGVIAGELDEAELEDVLVRDAPHLAILPETADRTILERLSQIAPATGLLVLAHKPTRAYRTAALSAGAACLARTVSAVDLLVAVHLMAQGEQVFTSADGHQVAHRQIDMHLLTARERDVLRHLTQGKSHAEIALVLDISVRTVQTHSARIFRKLDRHELERRRAQLRDKG